MFHLVGNATQRTIPEFRGLAADFRHVVAHRVGAAAQHFRYAAQGGGDYVPDLIDRLRRAGGGAAAGRLEAPLQCTQTLFNVTEISGDGTGMLGSRKHGCCGRARLSLLQCVLLSQESIWRSASSLAKP